jgi:hypothetical protein
VLVTGLACSLASAPAHARARVFVASYGNDANPCTFGSPCKTFQQAVNVVDAGGEVTAIDSAGFGPISINKAVTITSPDGVEAGIVPPAGGDAIDISAGPNDEVVLRGLTLNGSGIAFNGVVFNSGASLTIINCVMQTFAANGGDGTTGNGILLQPAAGTTNFAITNTIASNNAYAGVHYIAPSNSSAVASGVVDHVVTNNNFNGIHVNTFGASGGSLNIDFSNDLVSNNNGNGLILENSSAAPLSSSIDNTSITSSGNVGIFTFGNPTVLLGRSVITANNVGVSNNTTPGNTFYTYKDNRINKNVTDIPNPLNTTFSTQ